MYPEGCLLTRRERSTFITQCPSERVLGAANVQVRYDAEIPGLQGKQVLERIQIGSRTTKEAEWAETRRLVVPIGGVPNTDWAPDTAIVRDCIPKRFGLNPIRDIQVLCPMSRGGDGSRSLNVELQAASNPAGERKVERSGRTFAPGDKIMQIENDYDKEVYNGDIGYVSDVDPEAGELMASVDGRSVTYGFGELDTLGPAYAATIHKSQGSEYLAVIVPVLTRHYAMLHRNLLYTGITRGKRLVMLVGQKKAIAIAVRNVSGRRRWSKLGEWLRLDASRSHATTSKTD
jgi:ATP-dependent DNA helicase RecD-like protein/UvrD-like helicase family protein